MEPLPAFLATLLLLSIAVPRLGPFLSLVMASLIYGIITGMGENLLALMSEGLARIFSQLVIVVFCGAVLAEYLRKTGALEKIVSDLLSLSRKGLVVSGLAGYAISIVVMCSITAYMILEPIVSCLGQQTVGASRKFLFMTAACSVISFNLIYPSPVAVTLSSSFAVPPEDLLAAGIPISLILFAICYVYMQCLPAEGLKSAGCTFPSISRTRAWIPLVLPMMLIIMGVYSDEFDMIGNPSIALLLGSLICLALAKDIIKDMIHAASRRAGVIMLDLCGAGAFGYVVANSGFGQNIYDYLSKAFPILLLPFLVASILQLAQGSRVVTAVVSSQILIGYPLDGLTLALLISAGAFMFSFMTDPYFWLIKESVGSGTMQILKGYTLPLSLMGLVTFLIVSVSWMFL